MVRYFCLLIFSSTISALGVVPSTANHHTMAFSFTTAGNSNRPQSAIHLVSWALLWVSFWLLHGFQKWITAYFSVGQTRNSGRKQHSLASWKSNRLRHVCPVLSPLYSREALRWFHYLLNALPLRDLLNVTHCHLIWDQQRSDSVPAQELCSCWAIVNCQIASQWRGAYSESARVRSPPHGGPRVVIYLKQVTSRMLAFMLRLVLISHSLHNERFYFCASHWWDCSSSPQLIPPLPPLATETVKSLNEPM